MTISTVATLQAAAESWLERTLDDALFLEFANAAADTLMRGELDQSGRLWIVPPLRCADMEEADTLTTSGASVALPGDWLEFKRVWIDAQDGSGCELSYIPARQFKSDADATATGTPRKFTLDGGRLYVAPTSDADLEVSYYKKLGGFTGDASTDTVLAAHPRIYLSGVLCEASNWLSDFERADREKARMGAAVRGLNVQDKLALTSGGILAARPAGVA